MTGKHRRKHRRRQVVGTLAPLGLVAVGWLGMGVLPGASLPTAAPLAVPPAPAAPDTSQADAAPATADQVGQADADDLQLAAATRNALLDTATTTDIPAKALAAYQRAALVIDSSDKTCHLDWTLLAGIGKVESDHGRTGLGRSTRPGIFGLPLNGRNGTAVVKDTDGGKVDGSKRFDRAVGPMQFLPSTWAVVGVDGNGDGKRDPQNISDAALGAAVYLCGNSDDLATKSGQRAAVHRYNHSDSYVDLVIAIARSYAASQPATTFVAPHAVQIGGPATTGNTVVPAVTTKKTTPAKTPTTKAPVKTPPKTPTTPPVTPGGGGGTPPATGGGTETPPAPVTVAVPATVGQGKDTATSALTDAGLKSAVTSVFSSTVVPGLVISSDKAAGAQVAKGSTVGLTVSLGPVPTVVGLQADVAQRNLLAVTLNSRVVVEATFSDVPAGQVVSTSAVDQVAQGASIVLTVSKGPDPAAS